MMKKLIFLFITLPIILTSCGSDNEAEVEADCSCDEVVYNNGKWYQTGMHREGDRVKSGEIFTGICATLNQNNEVIEKGKFENGYAINRQKWTDVDGVLIQTLDMEYEKNRKHEGYRIKLEFFKGFVYPIEYWKYENGKSVSNYSMKNGYGKTLVSGNLGDDSFEVDCIMLGYSVGEFELLTFLNCLKEHDLPKFFVIDKNNVQAKFNKVKKERKTKQKEQKLNQIPENKQEDKLEDIDEESTEYYTVKDPDGYSNLRKTPGGEILLRVNEGEIFEVLGEENKHKKVKLSDGTVGYIHESRVVKNK